MKRSALIQDLENFIESAQKQQHHEARSLQPYVEELKRIMLTYLEQEKDDLYEKVR